LVPKGYRGITLYPFIVLRNSNLIGNQVLLNHENIHLKQQLELLILPFYVWYSFEFLVRFVQFKSWGKAYRNISFEREAYHKEYDLDYLNNRKLWSFLKYLRLK